MNLPQIVTSNHAASVPTAIAPLATRCLSNARARLAVLVAVAGLMLPAAASAQQADGERLFRQRCGTCHSLETSQKRAGPHLSGVIGRAAGSVEGARYSAAMRESGIAWDSQSLDTFLAAPRQMVPGTSMTVSIPNAAQRAAIISYLENQGAGGQESLAENKKSEACNQRGSDGEICLALGYAAPILWFLVENFRTSSSWRWTANAERYAVY